MAKTEKNFIRGKLIYGHSLRALVSCAADDKSLAAWPVQRFFYSAGPCLTRSPFTGSWPYGRFLIFSRVSLGATLTKCFSGGRAGNCWPDQPPCFQAIQGTEQFVPVSCFTLMRTSWGLALQEIQCHWVCCSTYEWMNERLETGCPSKLVKNASANVSRHGKALRTPRVSI